MNLMDLALQTRDYDWAKKLSNIREKIDKEIESDADNFLEYFSNEAAKENSTIGHLLIIIKEDTEGLSEEELDLYLNVNFNPKHTKKIKGLLNNLKNNT